jgi:hypothetical protein
MSLTKITHNVLTGEIIETNLTNNELLAVEANAEHGKRIEQTAQAEAAAKESARQALLSKLGITQEEAQLLLGGK